MLEPSTINRHEVAIYPAMAMLAGMHLDVFTPLKDGSLTGAEIAAAIGVKPAKLMPLLYALSTAELLTVENDRFSNTAEADAYLVRGRPSYMGASKRTFYSDIWQALLKTADTIRAGAPQHKHDFHAMSEDELASFFQGQHFSATAAGEQLARVYDLSRFGHMLDVGAGSGGLSIGVIRTYPELRVTAADLAQVIPVTRRFLKEAALADRVETVAADVVTGAPPGVYDVAVMRNLIQVLSLEKAQAAVCNVAKSLTPGGAILIVGLMIEDTRQSPAITVGQNLVMLNIYDDGLFYTEGEYRALLVEAGFANIDIRKAAMPGGSALISARKLS
jgi:2-polyprenyl-3-methyl-5-hydroxy-6-metoxy-1,4-benzoquinol methylase